MTDNITLQNPYSSFPGFLGAWRRIDKWVADYAPTTEPEEEKHDRIIRTVYLGEEMVNAETKVDSIAYDLFSRVILTKLPQRWREDGVVPPNHNAKQKGAELVSFLYNKFSMIPIKIGATVEGGIFLKFNSLYSGNDIAIEIYNDLDVAALVTRNKKPILAIDIHNEKDLEMAIEVFQKR
jgi:hypothetical protein